MKALKILLVAGAVANLGWITAGATNLTVGIKPADGVAMFVKQFSVAAGTTILGAEFVNNDSRTVFPDVVLVRGASSAMGEGTVVAEVTDASEVSGGMVRVTWEPSVTAATTGTYFVGVRIPEGSGKQGPGDGPAIGASTVAEPNGSFIASGEEGTLTAMNLDLTVTLVTEGAGKASAEASVPLRTFLGHARPNPFNPSTTIEFGVTQPMAVQLKIYDVVGRQIRAFPQETLAGGAYQRVWNGRNDEGRAVAAGIYVVRLVTDEKTFQKKIVLVK